MLNVVKHLWLAPVAQKGHPETLRSAQGDSRQNHYDKLPELGKKGVNP